MVETGGLRPLITGTRPDLSSTSFCRMGAEISRFLMLVLSGFALVVFSASLLAGLVLLVSR